MWKHISFQIIVAIINYLLNCEIVHCQQNITFPKLDFWERDQFFETEPPQRARQNGLSLSGKTLLDQIYAFLNRSNIPRSIFETNIRKNNVALQEIVRYVSGNNNNQERRSIPRDQDTHISIQRSGKQIVEPNKYYNKFPSHNKRFLRTHEKSLNLRDGNNNGINEPWPRVRSHRTKTLKKEFLRSTMMTPMYLMLKDETETTKDDKKKKDEGIQLSPYSVKSELIELAQKFPNVNITIEVIGRTLEYNDIVLLKAAQTKSYRMFRSGREDKYVDDEPEKKIVFIVHALSVMGYQGIPCFSREKSLVKLLSYYFDHLDQFNFYIIPMANPDGVANGGMWNKNMSPQSACPGVALDRNFDVSWNSSTSIISCSQQYPGPYPFSELETQAIKKVFHQYGHKIAAYFHVHAGTYYMNDFKGDAVLYPKGYTDHQVDDDKYIDLKGEIEEAMKNASFRVMSVLVDTLHHWYGGPVTGTSVDYAATVYGIPYAMEFVMQIYSDLTAIYDFNLVKLGESVSNPALEEIWKRVIDVILNNISKNLMKSE